jgi:CheY-like chemotaxis protein
MDEETRERVFEAFFTTKDRRRGTGLGLYVVYSLVGVMQGTVRVESSPGRGTTVAIELPAVAGAAAAAPAPLGEAEMAGGDETVLIVEDRAEVRGLVRTTLEGVGYTVLEAADGIAGLDLAARHPGRIDLVVSDVVMPRMSGPEMAEELRRRRPGIRVLLMSGHPERARHLMGALPDATLLMKPILPSDLCRHVRAALDGGPPETGAGPAALASEGS